MATLGDRPRRPSKPSSRPVKSTPARSASSFTSTKKDKQRIRHSQFVSKIAKSSTPATRSRRRRANKKLVTGLEELVEALPSSLAPDTNSGQLLAPKLQDQVRIIKQKSQRTRPGALKRKEKLEKLERNRFTKNMAQMAAAPAQPEGGQNAVTDANRVRAEAPESLQTASSAQKFAALRGFISQTMERRAGLER